MRCQSCDYELWHCTGRTCPECGDHFSLKDFFFEPDLVLFHCPHCDHGHAGVPPNGLLSLTMQQCEECGLAIDEEQVIVRPIIEGYVCRSTLPIWLKKGNWFTGYFQTVWMVLTKPQIAINRVSVREPLGCAAIVFFITLSITFIGYATQNTLHYGYSILPQLLFWSSFIVVAVLIYTILWACFTYSLLLLTGSNAYTFHRTMQTILYGGCSLIIVSVPLFVRSVPISYSLISLLLWIYVVTNMIIRGQRVSIVRSVFVTVLGALLALAFSVGFLVGTFNYLMYKAMNG